MRKKLSATPSPRARELSVPLYEPSYISLEQTVVDLVRELYTLDPSHELLYFWREQNASMVQPRKERGQKIAGYTSWAKLASALSKAVHDNLWRLYLQELVDAARALYLADSAHELRRFIKLGDHESTQTEFRKRFGIANRSRKGCEKPFTKIYFLQRVTSAMRKARLKILSAPFVTLKP